MKRFLILLTVLISIPAWSEIDTKNGNFATTFTDGSVPGGGFQLKISRTYNSRTLFDGMFGFGWCSPFETSLTVAPEGSLKLTECGGGMEVHFDPKGFSSGNVQRTIREIIAKYKARDPGVSQSYLNRLAKEMRSSDSRRIELAAQVGIHAIIRNGSVFHAEGNSNETITLIHGVYVRKLADGTAQVFDRSGHLFKLLDKNGNYLLLHYKNQILNRVTDNNNRWLQFNINPVTKKVSEIIASTGAKAFYFFKGDDLVKAKTFGGAVYLYSYDGSHNITRITYPDHTYQALTYNEDHDWVTRYVDRYKCVETYKYIFDKAHPAEHYMTKVVKRCGKKITNWANYEFWYKQRPDGDGTYLARVKTRGKFQNIDISYDAKIGRPLFINTNGNKVHFTYYPSGNLKTKSTKFETESFKYVPNTDLVSTVWTFMKDAKGKIVHKMSTEFRYDNKDNLKFAENSSGEKVWITYDIEGRMKSIRDQAKKLVTIIYDERFSKPKIVTRPGVGSIVVSYTPTGQVKKVTSKEGPIVAVQVASTFNNMLDIVAPAINGLSI